MKLTDSPDVDGTDCAMQTRAPRDTMATGPDLSAIARRTAQMQQKPLIRVLIADDHAATTVGVATVLAAQGIETVARCNRVDEVVPAYVQGRPDVVILDARFTGDERTGIHVTQQLLAVDPRSRIVIYSQFEQIRIIDEAYKSGARAFVPKSASLDELLNVIREVVATDDPVFLPRIGSELLKYNARNESSPQKVLDQREFKVFQCLAYGLTLNEIAARMDLSPRTVQSVANNVRAKLKVGSQADLVDLALRSEVGRP